MNDSVNFKIPHFFPMEMIFGTSKIDKITTKMDCVYPLFKFSSEMCSLFNDEVKTK